MEREFNNLNYLRSIGFTSYPHYVVRPLGRNASLNNVLVEEYCYGTPLANIIVQAIRDNARDILFEKLAALAYFLASLHNRTASDSTVDFNKDCSYFDRIMRQLSEAGRSDGRKPRRFTSSRINGERKHACGKTAKYWCTAMSLQPTSSLATVVGDRY